MTDWLVGGPADPGPELQAMMWRYHFRAVNVLLTGVLGCLALDLLIAVRLGLDWYVLPTAVHTLAGLYHVVVSIRIRHAIDGKGALPLASFVAASLVWTSLSGFAAVVAFLSVDIPLQIVVSIYTVGLASAIPGRHAAMPRIALVEIATILLPSFLVGAFAVGSLWFAMPILGAVFLFVGHGILTHVYHLELAVRQGELAGRTEARSDPLTGLGNRRGLDDLFDRAGCTATVASVLFLDLDGFKQVNDRLGHESGDELLVGVADRLRHAVGTSDTIHRVGGDEFVVVTARDGRNAIELGLAIVAALSTPLSLAGDRNESVRVGVSVGMVTYDPTRERGAIAMRRADRALYQAKARGKGCVVVAGTDGGEGTLWPLDTRRA